jgi:tRNA A37 threonylcarbamoyladenosine dehydratase
MTGSPFQRSIELLGEDGYASLQRSFVVVLGLGGVGSHAACALARTGVGRLRLVDFDQVTLSSLNRSAVFARGDVGRAKTDVLGEHLARIAPEAEIDLRRDFFAAETADSLLADQPDFVVDAIDSEGPKLHLLATCVARGLAVVSCMGAAARRDPTQVRVADIGATSVCPLARNIRSRLRKAGIHSGVTCVYSLESPMATLPPDPNEPRLERGRIRRQLPSIITIPAIFGLTAAGVVCDRLSAG